MEDICRKRNEKLEYSVTKQTEKKSYVSKQDFLIGHTGIFKDIKSLLVQSSHREDIEASLVYFNCFQLMPGSITRDE